MHVGQGLGPQRAGGRAPGGGERGRGRRLWRPCPASPTPSHPHPQRRRRRRRRAAARVSATAAAARAAPSAAAPRASLSTVGGWRRGGGRRRESCRRQRRHAGQRHGAHRGPDLLRPGPAPPLQDPGERSGRGGCGGAGPRARGRVGLGSGVSQLLLPAFRRLPLSLPGCHGFAPKGLRRGVVGARVRGRAEPGPPDLALRRH